ncbi:hypothetical protein [Anaerospora hongkongensis]|uniref:hypothetical protein n=1 Tax=Anaerospora hongkongensis TaxID=244830 RepID=UPI0028A0176B|nr:hypothetical protein [Anaerospora hongkongensis]
MADSIKENTIIDEAAMLILSTSIWRALILCDDKAAMMDLNRFLGLLEGILPRLAATELERITNVLPLLMQSMETNNGLLIADILRFEIEPVIRCRMSGGQCGE